MGIVPGDDIGAGLKSSISDDISSGSHDHPDGESYPYHSPVEEFPESRGILFGNSSSFPRTNFQSHETVINESNYHHSMTNFENETSMEEITDDWICLHFDPGTESKSFQQDSLIEDHDESFLAQEGHLHGNDSTRVVSCNRSWDGILCWPETPEGTSTTLSCFSHLNGIQYDTSRTVSRICEDGGVWQNITNYTSCVPLTGSQVPDEGLGVTIHVYLFGYCLSLTALIIAMIIFLSFKWQRPVCSDFPNQAKDPWAAYFLPRYHSATPTDMELRCLRNKIHTNLIVTYILAGTLWIITNFTTAVHSMSQKGNNVSSRVSCVTFILLHYFHLTNFFMMFVEGLYLYVLVVQTFMAENIKLRVYAAIGWGIPLLIMVGWSITKWLTHSVPPDALVGGEMDPEFMVLCIVVAEDVYDWIYKAPVFLCLFANVLFLVRIMWVLITKLRSATSPETQQSRKAAKALIVLMPLLGITYVFILTGPKKFPAFEHLRALLISTQGFLVALLYCFLNGEVRIALRHRWNRLSCCWGRGSRGECHNGGVHGRSNGGCCSKVLNFAGCCCYCCCKEEVRRRRRHNQYVRDLSPTSRSRTESNFFKSSNRAHRKRASSSSEATTMSTFSFSGGRTSINGLPFLQPLNPAAAKRLSMLGTSPGPLINDTILSI